MVGKETPGAGAYREKSFTKQGPSYSVTKDPRFYVPAKATAKADHAYFTPAQYMQGRHFSTDKRWKYRKDDKL